MAKRLTVLRRFGAWLAAIIFGLGIGLVVAAIIGLGGAAILCRNGCGEEAGGALVAGYIGQFVGILTWMVATKLIYPRTTRWILER